MSKLVCLDAGHGGTDPGACGGNLKEKDITLSVVKKIGEQLKKYGVNVIYSRDQDKFVPLGERCDIANKAKANLFVSVHCNSFSNINSKGIETYCYQFKYRELADKIHKRVTSDLSLFEFDRGVKEGDFQVLRSTNMSACLIELAFISNANDRVLLTTKQDSFAKLIAQGILDALGISCTKEENKEAVKAPEEAPIYHVVVGDLTSKEKANELAELLKGQGFKNIMISASASIK